MASIEALWTIEFGVIGGWQNGGVVVFETGRVFGGDSQYYYRGTFSASGEDVQGEARITHYQGPVHTAWGDSAKDFTVKLSAKRNGNTMDGVMWRPEAPQTKQLIRFTRRAALP